MVDMSRTFNLGPILAKGRQTNAGHIFVYSTSTFLLYFINLFHTLELHAKFLCHIFFCSCHTFFINSYRRFNRVKNLMRKNVLQN